MPEQNLFETTSRSGFERKGFTEVRLAPCVDFLPEAKGLSVGLVPFIGNG